MKEAPLLIIDGYGFIFRAYHVQQELISPKGISVGALYGFTSMLIKLIRDFKPQNAVMVLDYGRKNFRHEIYPKYKANRPKTPQDLIDQLKLVRSVAEAMNFKCMSYKGYEADDVIATLASKCTEYNKPATIISADKDLMQLISPYVRIYNPIKEKYVGKDDVVAKFGVTPDKIAHLQSLIGDSSDNVPGVGGIGQKTGAKLINRFGTVDNVLSSIDKIDNPRIQKLLRNDTENALLSWKLVNLDKNVKITEEMSSLTWESPKPGELLSFLAEYGFWSLKKRIEIHLGLEFALNNRKNKSDKFKIIEVNSILELESINNQIQQDGFVGVKIYMDNEIKIALSCGGDVYLVKYDSEEFNLKVRDLFKDESIKKVTYDFKELSKYCKSPLLGFEDIKMMNHVLDKSSTDMKDVIKKYTKLNHGSAMVRHFIECYHKLIQGLYLNKKLELYHSHLVML